MAAGTFTKTHKLLCFVCWKYSTGHRIVDHSLNGKSTRFIHYTWIKYILLLLKLQLISSDTKHNNLWDIPMLFFISLNLIFPSYFLLVIICFTFVVVSLFSTCARASCFDSSITSFEFVLTFLFWSRFSTRSLIEISEMISSIDLYPITASLNNLNILPCSGLVKKSATIK